MLTIESIKQKIIPLAEKYQVAKVDLFGSYANGNMTEKSDIDLLVKFKEEVPSIFFVMGFQEELKKRLDISVDVVTLPLARPEYLKIERTVTVYERP
jgi:predicted nucleotidyltransferase